VGISSAIVRAAANTSTGDQSFTTPDFGGGTPKACIVIYNEATADGTAINELRQTVGFATGSTNRNCGSCNSEHGQGASDASGHIDADKIIRAMAMGSSGTTYAEADFVEFLTDGIKINWSTAPSSAHLITVILLGGSDLSAFASSTAMLDIDNNTIDETGVGFQPDIVLGMILDSGVASGHGPLNLGVGWDNAGTIVERCNSQYHKNGVTTMDVSNAFVDTGFVNSKFRTSAEDFYVELSDFDSSGFSHTTRSGGANACTMVWMALKFGGSESVHFGTYTTPVTGGNKAETGPGFKPQLVIMGVTGSEAINTHYDDNRGGTWGVGVFTPDSEFCNSGSDEDGVTTSNTQSLSDNVALNVPDDDGTAETTASFVSMDANGFTLNYSVAPATAKLYWMLSIEEEAAAGRPPQRRIMENVLVRHAEVGGRGSFA